MDYGILIFSNLAVQTPQLIAILVGLAFAIFTWKRNPRPSLFAVIGFGLMMLLLIGGDLTTTLPFTLQQQNKMSMQVISMITLAVNIIFSLFYAIGWGFIVAAIFSGRKK